MELKKTKTTVASGDESVGQVRNRLYQRRFYLRNRLKKIADDKTKRDGYDLQTVVEELAKTNVAIRRYRGLGPGRPPKERLAGN